MCTSLLYYLPLSKIMTKEGKTTDDIADYSQDKQLSLQPLHEWNILKKERTRQIISFLNWSGNYVSPKKNELTHGICHLSRTAHFF